MLGHEPASGVTRPGAAMAAYEAILAEIGDGLPDAAQYQRLSELVLDVPRARRLARMDPFAPGYRAAAMELYLSLRGRAGQGYVAARDEAHAAAVPADLWRALVPWSFGSAAMVSEHLLAWGHIFAHLNLPAGGAVLEYGPGSGQILLMAARTGYRAFGVDINPDALAAIAAQAKHLGLSVELEAGEFGAGFAGRKFDTILFYEAFHHAIDFDRLLGLLHTRLNPGGRVVLCGEPIVAGRSKAIPYPWGPRLDGLSVFCMRRFGWMELGFTHRYLMRLAREKHWTPRFYPFAHGDRAAVYVLEPADADAARGAVISGDRLAGGRGAAPARAAVVMLATALGMIGPLRAGWRALARVRGRKP